MTKIKFCGLTRPCDIEAANTIKPDYIGFVFAPKSKRYVSPKTAATLKRKLDPCIKAVGVFVNEEPETVADLLCRNIIDIAQLHGGEDEAYIRRLRSLTDRPILKAFRIEGPGDIEAAKNSSADFCLLDSGSGGTGSTFDWSLLSDLTRPYFLAGGLTPDNVYQAIQQLAPYAVDVSSGIETDGKKDAIKMAALAGAVREMPKPDTINTYERKHTP